jgi:hypothetical protein
MRARLAVLEDALCRHAIRGIGFHTWNAHFLSSVLLESNVEMVESKNEPSPQTSALKGATPKIVINAA